MTQGIASSVIHLRPPVADDAPALHRLVAACPPLDPNSLYCNLLHCTHFANTSVAAVAGSDQGGKGRLIGFISAYIPPRQPDVLFVWQVAVAAQGRGRGLAARMLDSLLERPECAGVRYVDTTITPGNQASWALFESWAARRGVSVSRSLHFECNRHFDGRHDDEYLARIGPLEPAAEAVA